jgi:hypothetical protein
VLPVSGYDGEEANLSAMVTGKPPILFSVAHPYTYESRSAVDVLGRWKAGLPLPEGVDRMPNARHEGQRRAVAQGQPSGIALPPPAGDCYSNYKKLWGKAYMTVVRI